MSVHQENCGLVSGGVFSPQRKESGEFTQSGWMQQGINSKT